MTSANLTPRLFSALLALVFLPMSSAHAEFLNYRRKAEAQTAFIQKTFYDPEQGLYRPAFPVGEKGLPYDFMWANGVQFTALVSAARSDPKTYKPVLYKFAEGLKKYWDKDAKIPGFDAYWSSPDHDDKYYDDNQWLVLGFVEAYEVTKDQFFLAWARETHDFVMSGWDDVLGGGIYWHQNHRSKNTCSNAPAAASALRLYRVGRTSEDRKHLESALRIRHWLNANLKDDDGLYWDNISINGRMEETKWTYNTALPIRTDLLLYDSSGIKQYLAEARRMADAAIERWVDPDTGAMQNSPKFTHLLSEALLQLYDATREPKYLNVVRRYADYAHAHGRHPDGGYRDDWRKDPQPGDRRQLIENASMARLFWLLSKYPDADELVATAEKRIADREWARAEPLLRQAVETAPDNLRAHVRFHEVLSRRGKTDEAEAQAVRLAGLAKDSDRRTRLESLGWRAASN